MYGEKMLKTKRRIVFLISYILTGLAFILVTFYLVTQGSFFFAFIAGAIIFLVLLISMDNVESVINH